MKVKQLLEEQIEILADWNKKHVEEEPEQARKNSETLCMAISLLLAHPGMR